MRSAVCVRSRRQAGEGTGRAIDLDRFDKHYRHLFAWNHSRGELVGAYRLALTTEILPKYGLGGLYTSTLFRYGRNLSIAPDPRWNWAAPSCAWNIRSNMRRCCYCGGASDNLWRGVRNVPRSSAG